MNAISLMKSIYSGRTRILAPLVGGSDLSFRLLSRKYGAQVTFTEMCVAEFYLSDSSKHKGYTFEFDPSDRPLILQLAGNEAKSIIKLANDPIFKDRIDAVDLNCGCPQGFAREKGYGCALLQDPDHLVEMCKEIVENINYPLSVKLRLKENVDHTIDIIKRLKESGVAAFTVHGRFGWQRGEKRGLADWDAIKKIKATFPDIVVIGNGNIGDFDDFEKIMEETGVDGGMAGYSALIKPHIFQKESIPVSKCIEDYLNIARTRINGWIDVKRHIQWLVKGYSITPLQKSNLFTSNNLEELCAFMKTLDPPIVINLDSLDPKEDKIQYPFPVGELTGKKLKKKERAERKRELNLKKDKFKDESERVKKHKTEEETKINLKGE